MRVRPPPLPPPFPRPRPPSILVSAGLLLRLPLTVAAALPERHPCTPTAPPLVACAGPSPRKARHGRYPGHGGRRVDDARNPTGARGTAGAGAHVIGLKSTHPEKRLRRFALSQRGQNVPHCTASTEGSTLGLPKWASLATAVGSAAPVSLPPCALLCAACAAHADSVRPLRHSAWRTACCWLL